MVQYRVVLVLWNPVGYLSLNFHSAVAVSISTSQSTLDIANIPIIRTCMNR